MLVPTSPLSLSRSLATEATHTPYAKLSGEDITAFASLMSSPSTSIITTITPSESSSGVKPVQADELDGFNQDWMNKYKGHSQCVLKPKTTQELADVMKYCYEKRIAVVPQGGNTGLVGGSVPVEDEVIISTANLNSIREFDEVSGTLVCDAGCILEVLDNHIAPKGYMMPLDLGAKGSCHIGGNVATNAGGLRFLRYGSLHGNVLGLEVVLPNGEILDGLSTLRKDNTGFDLKQLFIGSEGSIGIITGVSIVTPRRPSAQNVAVFALDSFEAVQNVFGKVKSHCGEILSAFEFFDQDAFELVQGHATAGVKDPFEARHPFYVLIETSGSNKDHDDEKLSGLLEELMEGGSITDGVMAQDETQVGSLWALRESIPEAAGKYGSVYKYDLSMPIPKMNELVLDMRARFEERGVIGKDKTIKTVVGYGHIGDGNLHINIVADRYTPETEALIEPYIYEWTAKQNGSISAEHGLGVMKAEKIGYTKSKTSVAYMQKVKDLFDPKRILNPNKYLPAQRS
ncbi:putative DLD2-D-lactate dehydrogenase [Microstroma glucosiphilum]|uniref:Putative DLD2-D-lactate dehydrogenase n=1 Tax=Pseudomicrostroma glucosiphilum TaxID=1684307 RepID=A0A316U150_9BASI|nr:putative DLD2-D-lactate dehydrogenase [Pseudomicrostroma glucosiphilum]PWN19116.1 putative DLD2-D-lactate dehydrogenase [Pseudomicrostroma glucosiphilum]